MHSSISFITAPHSTVSVNWSICKETKIQLRSQELIQKSQKCCTVFVYFLFLPLDEWQLHWREK